MSLWKTICIAIVAGALASSGAAFAKDGTAQTHHCRMPDGTMDMTKTHKQCTAAKGTWAADTAKEKEKESTSKTEASKDPARDTGKAKTN